MHLLAIRRRPQRLSYEAIQTFDDASFFENAIIERYQRKHMNSWIFDQLSGLLYMFAINGSKSAESALYQKFEYMFHRLIRKRSDKNNRDEKMSFEWLCIWIIYLGGFDAFKEIVMKTGAYYAKTERPDRLELDWFYTASKNEFGEEHVNEYLESQALVFESVSAFLKDAPGEQTINEDRPVPLLQNYIKCCQDIVFNPENNRKGFYRPYIARRLAQNATKEELVSLANTVLSENNLKLKSELLFLFRFVEFPLDIMQIVELTKSDDKDVRAAAFSILESDRIQICAIMQSNF